MQTLAVIDEVCDNALHTANIDVLKTKPVVSFYAPDEGGGKISGWFAMKNAFDFHPSDQPFVSGATLGNRLALISQRGFVVYNVLINHLRKSLVTSVFLPMDGKILSG